MSERIELPMGWKKTELGEVVKKISTKALPTEMPDIKFIGMDSIAPNQFIPHLLYSFSEFKSAGNKFVNDNVLYGRMRPYLNKVFKANFEGACSGEFIVMDCLSSMIPDYLKYILHHRGFVEFANNKTTGDRPRVTFEEISNYTIFLPPSTEQHRIVDKIEELFSDLDNGIENLKTAQKQLKTYRQAVLKWAFEGKLTDTQNIQWVELGTLCYNVEYGTAAKSKKTGEIPVLRMGNIQGGKFIWDDLVYTDNEEEINKYWLQKNDVLFNRTNSPEWVGKTALYKGERPAIFAGYLIRINYKSELLNPVYLTYFLNSQTAKNYGNSVKSFGVNQSNINGTKLKKYPFPVTTLTEQQAIVAEIESRLSVCDKLEESIEQSLVQAEALRQSILKKAFEGKLVPQDPNDEPASVLLARIEQSRNESIRAERSPVVAKQATTARKRKRL